MQKCFALLGASLLLAGCSHPNPIVGIWSGTWTNAKVPHQVPGASYKITATYNADGTGSDLMEWPLGTIGGNLTYDIAGDTITQTAVEVIANGKRVPLDPKKPLPSEVYHFNIAGDTLTMERPANGTKIVMKRAE